MATVASPSALAFTAHRPWPLPSTPWRWRQTWHDLLFLHWPVPVETLRPHVPAELAIDVRDGTAWLGLVPFHMSGVTMRGMPPLPWLSAFPEMNLRTYVTRAGRPGVWFLRMDAARALAVGTVRVGLGVPYVWSTMRVNVRDEAVTYTSRRSHAVFDATYAPAGPPRDASPGSLEVFLTERYCLYTRHVGRLWRLDIHHVPWPLQPAVATVRANTIAESRGLPGPPADPRLHFAKRIDVVGWGCTSVP